MNIKKYGKTFPKNNLALMMFMDGRGQEFIWANFWIFNGEFNFLFLFLRFTWNAHFRWQTILNFPSYVDGNLYNKFLLALFMTSRATLRNFYVAFQALRRETFLSQIKSDALRNLA